VEADLTLFPGSSPAHRREAETRDWPRAECCIVDLAHLIQNHVVRTSELTSKEFFEVAGQKGTAGSSRAGRALCAGRKRSPVGQPRPPNAQPIDAETDAHVRAERFDLAIE